MSLEGQLIFDIGPRIKRRFVIDNIDYQMPYNDVIQVVSGPVEGKKGVLNNNIEDPVILKLLFIAYLYFSKSQKSATLQNAKLLTVTADPQ